MLISKKLAEIIVQRAMNIIHHNVNVIDHNGVIIASGDSYRVGDKHGVACQAILTRKRIVVDKLYKNDTYENVQLGINHPIIIDDQVVLVIGVSGNPAIIERYAELAILTAELLIIQSNEIRKINWHFRIRDILFKQFLDANDNKYNDILFQLSSFDINLDDYLQPVLIQIKVNGSQQEKAIDNIINSLFIFIRSQRVILLSNDKILLLLKGEAENNLIQKIDQFLITQLSHYVIAVGYESKDSTTFRQSFFALNEMIEHHVKYLPNKRLLNINEYAFDGWLNYTQDNPYLSFFNNKIQRLRSVPSGDDLIETLITFIQENAQISSTATRLCVHRNTLHYRFKQIKKITGLDPLHFKDLMQLDIAIYYYQLNL